MRKIKFFMVLVLLAAGVSGAWAQSYVYKGVTAEQARSNSSDKYYLYNVGTGTFLYIGSSWGTKGSLLYSDLGLPVTVGRTSVSGTYYYRFGTPLGGQAGDTNGYFGMVQVTDNSNTPGLYGDRSSVLNGSQEGTAKFMYNHLWTLEPAAAPAGVTQYYLKNLGCSMRAQDYTYIYGDNNNLGEVFFSRDKDENSSFYKWSIVSQTEILSVINSELAESFGGLNASLTFLINDQGFYCKNKGGWQTNSLIFNNRNTAYGTQTSLVGEASNPDQLSFGKYYHANIGISGSATEAWLYQVIDAPKAGLYHVYCQGFDSAGDGAEFIAVSGQATPTSMKGYNYSNPEYSKVNLKKAADGLTATSPIYVDDYQVWQNGAWVTIPQELTKNNLAAGVAFYKNEYTNDLFVYVPNDNGKITIAIHKTNKTSYTAVDDFHVVYLGASIFVFDENETDGVKTLKGESTVASELVAARNTEEIQTMGTATVLMKRSMSVNNWNTLVLPFSLSATAFKRAFGETAQLATCDGLDQSNPNIIKFTSRSLASDEGIVVEKGKFYLVKPALKPSQLDEAIAYVNYDGTPKTIAAGTEYYNLSRQDLSGGSTDGRDWSDDTKSAFKTPESELYTAANHNSIQLKGTYYLRDNFADGDQRLYSDSPENQKYVFGHKGDTYAMWRLGETRRAIKGTRWWIEDVYSSGAKEMMLLSFNGVVDGDETLAIDMEEGFTPVVRMDNKVYNLNGQVVNATLESLPRGIYVVNGKKFVVK